MMKGIQSSWIDVGLIEEYLLDKGFQGETRRNYIRNIKLYGCYLEKLNIPLKLATTSDFEAFLDEQEEKYSLTTYKNIRNSIKSFYAWLHRVKGYGDISYYSKITPIPYVSPTNALSIEDARRLLSTAANHDGTLLSLRNHAILCLLLQAGMRPHELQRANVSDVFNQNGHCFLKVKPSAQSGESVAYIPKYAANVLSKYLIERDEIKSEDPLFTSCSARSSGKRLSDRSLRESMRVLFKKASVPRYSNQFGLRQTAIQLAAENGASDEELLLLTRTRNLSSIQRNLKPLYSGFNSIDFTQDEIEEDILSPFVTSASKLMTVAEIRNQIKGLRGTDKVWVCIDANGNVTIKR